MNFSFTNYRLSTLVDIACILMIGVGFGGLVMYYYAVNHPQDIYHAQPHMIIVPQQDNTTGKGVQAQPNQLNEI